MEKKFISLLNDSTFKFLWKNESTRSWLEEVIKLSTGIDLKDYVLFDNELNTGNDNKDYRLDIVLKKDNKIVNIEMNQYVKESVLRKNHTYLYRLAGSPYLEGESYDKVYVTQINFNASYCIENKEVKTSVYEFIDRKNDLKIEGIKDYEIYLANYEDVCYDEFSKLELYLAMFMAKDYDTLNKLAGNDKEAMKIVDELNRLSVDKYFGALYDASIVKRKLENSIRKELKEEARQEGKIEGLEEGLEEGRKEGIKQGRKQGLEEGKKEGIKQGLEEGKKEGIKQGLEEGKKEGIKQGRKEGSLNKSIEIAKAMLDEKIDINAISKCTGLSIEEINNLK